jgi:MGT family glycosyltransferase
MRLGGLAPARVVQPMRPEIAGGTSDALPPEIMALGDRPVLYVSLGTVPLFNQLSTFNVLLDALAPEDLDLVVTIGANNDPASLAGLPANVHIYRWLPLRPLLDRCDAVVCHGGSGTTLAALHAGLPLIIVPQGADQFENATACEKSGTARVLRPDDVEAAAVRDAVLAVTAVNSSERSAARAVAGEIAAMPTVFEATGIVETLM